LPCITSIEALNYLNDGKESKFKKGVYNAQFLNKTRTKPRFTTNIIGDSETAGTAATGNYGFAQQLGASMEVMQGNYNYQKKEVLSFLNFATWTSMAQGLNNIIWSSTNSSLPLTVHPSVQTTPNAAYTVSVIYSKRPDGGNFEIRESVTNTLIATVSCNGTYQEGIRTPYYNIAANNSVKIVPLTDNKAYVYGVSTKLLPTTTSYNYNLFGNAGIRAGDYSDADLVSTVSFDTPDLLIYALLANDYSTGDFPLFQQKTTLAIDTAKANGSDVIIVVTCGNSTSESGNFRSVWVAWLKQIALEKGCVLIDYDEIFGGYTLANANGLMADAVHPTNSGHLLMANTLVNVVLGVPNPYNTGVKMNNRDSRQPDLSSVQETSLRKTWDLDQFFDNAYGMIFDNNGNKGYRFLSPVIRFTNTSQLPKYAPAGQFASVGQNAYVNTTDWGTAKTTISTWLQTISLAQTELVTALPTVTTNLLGRLYRLSASGEADRLMMPRIKGSSSMEWIESLLVEKRPAPPTTNTYTKGEVMVNSDPDTGEPFGWACTVAGSPGTWLPFGTIDASTYFSPNLLTGYVSAAGTVLATDTVLQGIQKLNGNNALKADINSQTFTGDPKAPTPAFGDNDTSIANTAALLNQANGARYTPTAVTGANVTAVSVLSNIYTKIGNVVTVSGVCSATTTSGSVTSDYTITLPFPRATATAIYLGFGNTNLAPSSVTVPLTVTSSATTTATISFTAVSTGGISNNYTFSYLTTD